MAIGVAPPSSLLYGLDAKRSTGEGKILFFFFFPFESPSREKNNSLVQVFNYLLFEETRKLFSHKEAEENTLFQVRVKSLLMKIDMLTV